MNLYKLYHDFGDRFLRICTSVAQLPQVLDDEDTFTSGDLWQLKRDRVVVVKHITETVSSIRTLSAHGIYTGYRNYQDPSEKKLCDWMQGIIGKRWPSTDTEWKKIADKICDDADFVFHWFDRWADIWSHAQTGLRPMNDRFYYGHWKKNLYESTLQDVQSNLDMTPDNTNAVYTQSGNFTSFAKFFNPQFVENGIHSGYLVAACSNAGGHSRNTNQYGKNWRISAPDRYIDVLVGEINLPAIEAVRTYLLSTNNRQRLTYVDFYQIYLKKLSDEMANLPGVSVNPRSRRLGPRRYS